MRHLLLVIIIVFSVTFPVLALDSIPVNVGDQVHALTINKNNGLKQSTVWLTTDDGSKYSYNAFCMNSSIEQKYDAIYTVASLDSIGKEKLNLIAHVLQSLRPEDANAGAIAYDYHRTAQEVIWGTLSGDMQVTYHADGTVDYSKSLYQLWAKGNVYVDYFKGFADASEIGGINAQERADAKIDMFNRIMLSYNKNTDYITNFEMIYLVNGKETGTGKASQPLILWNYKSDPTVPEPTTVALISLGIGAIGLYQRRKNKK